MRNRHWVGIVAGLFLVIGGGVRNNDGHLLRAQETPNTVTITDPAGDTCVYTEPTPKPDIASVTATKVDNSVVFTIAYAGAFGWGTVWMDTDQNPATGRPLPEGQTCLVVQPIGAYQTVEPPGTIPPSGGTFLGVDYYIAFNIWEGTATLFKVEIVNGGGTLPPDTTPPADTPIATVPYVQTATSVEITIGLGLMGNDDGSMDFIVDLNLPEADDRAPNDGHGALTVTLSRGRTVEETKEVSTAPGYGTSTVFIQFWEAITNVDFSFTETEIYLRVDVGIFQTDPIDYSEGEYVNAWVDWNGNKVFETEEQILDGFYMPIVDGTVVPSLTFMATAPIPQSGGNLPMYMRVELRYAQSPLSVDTWNYGSVRDFLILDQEFLSETVIASSDIDEKVGLDRRGKTVKDFRYISRLTDPKSFPVKGHRWILFENNIERAVAELGTTAGEYPFFLPKGMKLDFAKTYILQGFLDKGLPTERKGGNKINLRLFRLRITATAPQTQFLITAVPAMPAITVTVAVEGLAPDPTPDTLFNWVTEVRYRDNGRNDETEVRQNDVRGANWTPNFGGDVVGGTIVFAVASTLEGQVIDAEIGEGSGVVIRGTNPTKVAIKARLGALENQVVGYKESGPQPALRFQQFLPSGLPIFHRDPGGTFGFGVMQLTDPRPIKTQIWNWHENVDGGLATIAEKQRDARVFERREIRTHDATAFTAEQFRLEWWQRYNSGRHFQRFDQRQGVWVPMPDGRTVYSRDALRIFNLVHGGNPPAGWND